MSKTIDVTENPVLWGLYVAYVSGPEPMLPREALQRAVLHTVHVEDLLGDGLSCSLEKGRSYANIHSEGGRVLLEIPPRN